MILNSKQLEELESIHDSVAEFEEEASSATENEGFDEGAESALAWRRGMIEKAAANVKKALKKHIDPQHHYSAGVLLFDREAKRFGRVNSSSSGSVRLAYIVGGEANIKQNQSEIAVTSNGSNEDKSYDTVEETVIRPRKEKAKQPLANTAALAPRLQKKKEDTEMRDMMAVGSLMAKENLSQRKTNVSEKKVAEKAPKQNPTLKTVTKTKPQKKAAKPVITEKKATKTKQQPQKELSKTKKSPVKAPQKAKHKTASYVSYLTPGAITDPVADPNGYIKQHFRLMSNKELAHITGLSEHTIRRKLGEWGLKRPGKDK